MVQYISHLVNTYHVTISMTWIFVKQIGLAIEIRIIRTNQVVFFLKAKNAKQEIQ